MVLRRVRQEGHRGCCCTLLGTCAADLGGCEWLVIAVHRVAADCQCRRLALGAALPQGSSALLTC